MKPGLKPHWNHYFSVQISKPRTWVRWDYCREGQKPRPLHVAPETSVLVIDETDSIEFHFDIAKRSAYECDGVKYVPTVCDKVVGWGWRIWSADSPQCNGDFNVAGSEEECLSQAMAYLKSNGLVPENLVVVDDKGGQETRPLPPAWQEFAQEALAAVESWASGKGWPAGWNGKPNA